MLGLCVPVSFAEELVLSGSKLTTLTVARTRNDVSLSLVLLLQLCNLRIQVVRRPLAAKACAHILLVGRR